MSIYSVKDGIGQKLKYTENNLKYYLFIVDIFLFTYLTSL